MASTTVKSLKGWLTTQQVADHYRVHPRVVLRMIREDRLSAEKLGWQWMIHESSLPETWPPPVVHSS